MSSIDPAHISDDLIELLATNKRMVPHLHLSLQSGNTLILKRMKRRYDANLVRDRIGRLRVRVPQLVMSADVMVGFPTETDQQFEDTWSLIDELEIAFPHVFSYSEREGTPAARIPHAKQVPVLSEKNEIRNCVNERLNYKIKLCVRELAKRLGCYPRAG